MWDALLWTYLINATLLLNHEIDSAYWKEWELFRLPGGITVFLIIHLPLVYVVLYGLVLVVRHTFAGLVISLVLGLSGLVAFALHTAFIKRGHPEFNTPISLFILIATLIGSLAQLSVVIHMFAFPPTG